MGNSMGKHPLPQKENLYETDCPILYAMQIIGQKWKLPILWYIAAAENKNLRYKELERKVVGITATMLTKCLRELEKDQLITRVQHNTIPPTVEYSLSQRGKSLLPALESLYAWAEHEMAAKEN
ncbi:MAG: helix-turn-helix transcriptional regulator [Desulfovibrio sp.]|nr:helix-turn-helix transcriptional regulator [Desulfovibrio sp.]